MYDWIFESFDNITVRVVPRNISSRFFSYSEASASELLENLEDIFLRYLLLVNRLVFLLTDDNYDKKMYITH